MKDILECFVVKPNTHGFFVMTVQYIFLYFVDGQIPVPDNSGRDISLFFPVSCHQDIELGYIIFGSGPIVRIGYH